MGVLVDYFTADSERSARLALSGGSAAANLPYVDCKGRLGGLDRLISSGLTSAWSSFCSTARSARNPKLKWAISRWRGSGQCSTKGSTASTRSLIRSRSA
ncbi:hypothetical protein [Planomonospora algeriensis]